MKSWFAIRVQQEDILQWKVANSDADEIKNSSEKWKMLES